MEGLRGAETRQRVIKWLEEAPNLVGLVGELFDHHDRLKARAEAIEQECEKLRRENSELLSEREEIAEALGRLMGEMVRPMNEIMQKIRGQQRRSPFEREPTTVPPTEPIRSASSGVAGH
jgi:hypothetical protein